MLPSYFTDYISNNKTDEKNSLIYSSYISDSGLFFPFTSSKCVFTTSDTELEYNNFFKQLWDIYLNNYEYSFSEKQYTDTILESGIRIDIDAYQNDKKRILDNNLINECVIKISKILYNKLDITYNYETYCVILVNDEPYLHKEKYKEGIHILFPGIKIQKEVKVFIIQEFADKIQVKFTSRGYMDLPVVDPISSHAPVELYGTIRKEKGKSHIIHSIYSIRFGSNNVIIELNPESYSYFKKKDKVNVFSNYNLIQEFSIHYPGKLIKKDVFQVKKEFIGKVFETYINVNNKIENDEEKLEKEINHLIEYSYKAKEVYDYVAILSPERGKGGNFIGWSNVVKTILNIDHRFKPIAKLFSIKCDNDSWNRGGQELLDEFHTNAYNTAMQSSNNEEKISKALGALKHMAREDDPASFNKLKLKTIEGIISSVIYKATTITHELLAKIVYDIAKDKIKYINVPFCGFGYENGFWLEYITPDRPKMPANIRPFIFKWYKHDRCPDEIDSIITVTIPNITTRIKNFFNKKKLEDVNKEQDKMFKVLTKRVEKLDIMCGTHSMIESIKKRCENGWFKDNYIIGELDKESNIIGVGNGLLIFDSTAKFINYQTEHKISRTTDTYYHVYDKENKYIKKIETILSEIITDPLKLKGLLMHLSMCFVKGKTDRYFNIFFSGGCSGKSILMQLIENALGSVANSMYGANFGYYDTINAAVFTTEKKDVNGVDHHLKKIEFARFIQCPEGGGGTIHPHIFKQLRDGCAVRGMMKETKNVSFGGIIAYITNHEVKFEHFNYALTRRVLYLHFTSKFVPNPKLPNEKKVNEKYREKSLKNKNWGAAFLSILVHHWNLLNKEYGNDIYNVYADSGLEKETNEFLDKQNYMYQFISKCVRLNVEDKKISILDFCGIYAKWYKKSLSLKYEVNGSKYFEDARNILENYIKFEEGVEYFDKIEIIEENL